MARLFAITAAAVASIACATAASATTLTFDDIGTPNTVYPYYTGTGFTELGYVFSDNADVIDISSTSGYSETGPAVSGNYAALNDFSGPMTMTQLGGGTFTLTDFFVRGWYGDTGTETVTGYLDGNVVDTLNYAITGSFTDIAANFVDVDQVTFNTNGFNFILVDNVTVNGSGAVPEPATWAMMLVGMGLVGAAARRKAALRVSYAA